MTGYLTQTGSTKQGAYQLVIPNKEVMEVYRLQIQEEIAGMEKACERAIAQIKERRYDDYLRNDGRQEILIYGMAFCRKKCRIIAEKMPRIRS